MIKRFALILLMLVSAGAVGLFGWIAWSNYVDNPTPVSVVLPFHTNDQDPIVYAVGDIADCGSSFDTMTADLVKQNDAPILTLGDNVYDHGTAQEFNDCYAPSWGLYRSRTRPSPGNHDYSTRNASAYYDYFGAQAGPNQLGYYRFTIDDWQLFSLNSNCGEVGGCDPGSAQYRWLDQELQSNSSTCSLAYFHHPRFSSGLHGDNAFMQTIWGLLQARGVDLVLSGHDHTYERFAPLDASGQVDTQSGMRQFVVGTGGKSLYGFLKIDAGSEVRDNKDYGVLELTLHPTSYSWRFLATDGRVVDSGTQDCHAIQ